MRTTPCLCACALATLAGAARAAAPFKDIPRNHWAFDEVHWLRADGMLEGWGGEFHGDRKFTRFEMAKVLSRYMKKYDGERQRIEGELGRLRHEDEVQGTRIDELYGRTSQLEARMASLDGGRAPISARVPSRPSAPRPAPAEPAPEVDPRGDLGMAAALERRLEAAPDPGLRAAATEAPLEVAPVEPVEPVAMEPAPAQATEQAPRDSEQERPAGPSSSLSERIASLRSRIRQRREERVSASGGDDGDAGLREAVEDLGPPPVSEPEVEAPPPPRPAAGATGAAAAGLSAEEQDRLQAIRERYMRLMKRQEVPAAGEDEAVVVPDIDAVGADPGGVPPDQQPLPGVAPRTGSRPIEGASRGQPLPGLEEPEASEDSLRLPSVGMGLGYETGI